jgi:hypothetical protein
MMKPTTLKNADELYQAVTKSFGLSELTPERRVESLLTMPQEKLVEQLTKELTSLGPVLDGELVLFEPTFANLKNQIDSFLPGSKWCKRLFTIESKDDV